MPEPLTATAIATLAFLDHLSRTDAGKTWIEGIFKKLGEKTLDLGLEKINALRKAIWSKLHGNPKVKAALEAAEQADVEAVETIAEDLQLAMNEDQAFATQMQEMAERIINIGKIEGKNIQNNYGGQNLQVNDPSQPVIQIQGNPNVYLGTQPNP